MYTPWLARHYPSFTPTFDSMIELRWSTFVSLADEIRKNG